MYSDIRLLRVLHCRLNLLSCVPGQPNADILVSRRQARNLELTQFIGARTDGMSLYLNLDSGQRRVVDATGHGSRQLGTQEQIPVPPCPGSQQEQKHGHRAWHLAPFDWQNGLTMRT